MKVSLSTSNVKFKNKLVSNSNNTATSLPKMQYDSVSFGNRLAKYFSFSEFVKDTGKVRINDYYNAYRYNYSIIYDAQNYIRRLNLNTTPKEVAQTALYLKQFLDSRYGEAGYRIVSLSANATSAAEALKKIGTDTIILPVTMGKYSSNPSCSQQEEPKKIQDYKIADTLLSYLDQKGVNSNSSKVNIFIDCAELGNIRDEIAGLAKKRNKLNPSKVITYSLQELISEAGIDPSAAYNPYRISQISAQNINSDCHNHAFERVSNYPSIDITDESFNKQFNSMFGNSTKKIDDYLTLYSNPAGRAFSLCVLDGFARLGLKANI